MQITEFDLASAERIGILIKFPNEAVGGNVSIQDKNGVFFNLSIVAEETNPDATSITVPSEINAPFTDLRKIPDS